MPDTPQDAAPTSKTAKAADPCIGVHSADAALLDEMERLLDDYADAVRDTAHAHLIGVYDLTVCKQDEEELRATVNARILALVAAARQGAEDTRLLREQSCEIGVRAAIGAIENTQARDAANAVLQDRYGAPAIQAALILRATTPSEATDA